MVSLHLLKGKGNVVYMAT